MFTTRLEVCIAKTLDQTKVNELNDQETYLRI